MLDADTGDNLRSIRPLDTPGAASWSSPAVVDEGGVGPVFVTVEDGATSISAPAVF